LLPISKTQANAILVALNRNKYIDYLIGALLGFITSFIVAYMTNKNLREKFTLAKKKSIYDHH
jgi:hypothetical protein